MSKVSAIGLLVIAVVIAALLYIWFLGKNVAIPYIDVLKPFVVGEQVVPVSSTPSPVLNPTTPVTLDPAVAAAVAAANKRAADLAYSKTPEGAMKAAMYNPQGYFQAAFLGSGGNIGANHLPIDIEVLKYGKCPQTWAPVGFKVIGCRPYYGIWNAGEFGNVTVWVKYAPGGV